MRITITAALLVMLTVSAGCGYRLYGHAEDGGTHKHYSVYVPAVKNETLEPLLDRDVTAALKDEILLDGRWKLTDPEEAELVLEGAVERFELQPLSYDPKERILEYRVDMRVTLLIRDTKTNEVLWKDPDMEVFAEYRVTQDITKSKIKKAEAIRKASKILAEDFIIKAVDTPF